MNTTHLKYIIAIAESHSINKAAKRLNLQHQYLSKIVQSMEENIGAPIFSRSHKGVMLTAAGVWFIQNARKIIELTDTLEQGYFTKQVEFFPEYHQDLSIYLNTKTEIFNIILEFKKPFPNVSFSMITKSLYDIPEIINQYPLKSFAIYTQSVDYPEINPVLSNDLTFLPINELPLVALAAKTNPLALQYKSISINTLLKQNLVIFEADSNNNKSPSFFRQLLSQFESPKINYRTINFDIIFDLLRDQNFFTIGVKGNVRNPDILEIPFREHIQIQTGLLFHKKMLDDFVGKHFINTYLTLNDLAPI